MSLTHNKNLNSLFNLLVNCISTKFAFHIFSIKGGGTFLLLNFLIIGYCNSLANFLQGVFSFLTPLLEAFYQKLFKLLK